ncbi:MAG: hypothetical protein K6L75_03220 [Cellvibrionaceae bacterium]|nr:hypothetical protein [Motiliproteus sp.]MCW9052162.1 hypothetical protein [Motiliproteus sp.]
MSERLSSLCLIMTMAVMIGYKLYGGPIFLIYIAVITLILFLYLQRHCINRIGRVLLSTAIVSTVLLNWCPDPALTFNTALTRANFFAAFLAALAFIRFAAKHSLMVKRCGKIVISQPPSRRYGIITLSAYTFGNVLNFGVLHLLGQMIEKGNTLESAGGLAHVQEKRRQRMSLALLRGFALLPLASPFSIALTLMLATIPGLKWQYLLAAGTVTAVILFFLGWGEDYVKNPKQAPTSALYSGPPLTWRPAYQFLGMILGIFILAVLLEQLTSATLPVAIMILCPIVSLAWFGWGHYERGLKANLKDIKRDLPLEINGLHSEISIISSACFFGVVLSDLLPRDSLIAFMQSLHLSGATLAISLCVLVTLLSQIGLNPFITATIFASSFTPTETYQLSPELLALALMSGWCLAMNSSPVSISAIIISSVNKTPSRAITHQWNGNYSLMALLVLCVWIGITSQALLLK